MKYGSVLFQYDLYPKKFESHGKVKKIVTKKGDFALKETDMTAEQREWLVHVFDRLQQFSDVKPVPVVPTKYGDPFVILDGKTYYLMPWLTEISGVLTKEEVLIEEIAKIHVLTEKEQEYDGNVIKTSFDTFVQRWDRNRVKLKHFTETIAKKIYQSPFELTFLKHSRTTFKMMDEAKKYLLQWCEMCKSHQRFRTVLCHGRPSINHFIVREDRGTLLNLEHTVLDTPARDIAIFIRKMLPSENEGRHLLYIYNVQFPLRDEEKWLLAAYLCYPENIFRSVEAYQSQTSKRTESVHVKLLEKRFEDASDMRKIADSL